MKVVVIAPPSFDALNLLREKCGDIDLVVSEETAELEREIADAEVVTVAARHGRLFATLWHSARKLRWVHALGAGVEALMFDELLDSDVLLTNSRGVFADALGEWAMAAILWFAKDLRRLVRQQSDHRWQPYTVTRIEGQTVGIVGLGGIGRAVARRARAFGMHVIATRRQASTEPEPLADRMVPVGNLDDLAAASDYLVICTPLTPKTRGLVTSAVLDRLKPDAVVINIARGAVVDEDALIARLEQRQIRGAALDVFRQEPLPASSPLWNLDNVLLSPHTADHVADSHYRAMLLFIENLALYRRGELPLNVVRKGEQY